jgi:hypothetical protein
MRQAMLLFNVNGRKIEQKKKLKCKQKFQLGRNRRFFFYKDDCFVNKNSILKKKIEGNTWRKNELQANNSRNEIYFY